MLLRARQPVFGLPTASEKGIPTNAFRSPWLAAVLLVWLLGWNHLSEEWRVDEQYHFAWIVPAYFLFAAWRKLAGPTAPNQRLGVGLSFAACPIFLLAEIMRWQDPIWRLTGALFTASASLFTAGLLIATGGWMLLRRQIWPLVIAWSAVPWPVHLEMSITQRLLQVVTACVVNLLNLAGIDAIQKGNLVLLGAGRFGMSDACSGMRSLQASLMLALLFGEIEDLPAGRRILLVVLGALAAVAVNVLRVLSLAMITGKWGEAAAANIHDAAGFVAALAMVAILYQFASMATAGSNSSEFIGTFPGFPREGRFGWALLLTLACLPLAMSAIARSLPGNSESGAEPRWRLEPNAAPLGWHAESFPEREENRARLRYSTSEWCKYVSDRDHVAVYAVHLFWGAGRSMPGMAFYHTPAMCMPWVGWSAQGNPRRAELNSRGERLPFTAYLFRQGDIQVAAYHLLSISGTANFFTVNPDQMGGKWARFTMLWRKPLRHVDEELLFYVANGGDSEREERILAELLDAVLQRNRS